MSGTQVDLRCVSATQWNDKEINDCRSYNIDSSHTNLERDAVRGTEFVSSAFGDGLGQRVPDFVFAQLQPSKQTTGEEA